MVRHTKHCINCDKCLDKRHYTKFCSDECRNEYNLKRSREIANKNCKGYKDGKFKTHCIICNRFFAQKNATNKICSDECRKKQRDDIKSLRHGGNTRKMKLRFEIFKRDNFTCQYCGRNVKDHKVVLHCDHVHPNAKGGKFKQDNLITACQECNLGKRDVLLKEKCFN